MRVRFIQGIDALVVVGGKGGCEPELKFDSRGLNIQSTDPLDPPWGRFPGLAEEVMLALAFSKPVYIIGMSQGAAKDIGILLGLANTQLYVSNCLPDPEHANYSMLKQEIDAESCSFQVAHKPALPQDFKELRNFFCEHALDFVGWPSNGLTPQENRMLFDAQQTEIGIEQCIQLIIRGVMRLDWTRGHSSGQ